MRQILVFVLQLGEIAILQGVSPMTLGDCLCLQETGLSQEDGFKLKQIVTMLADG
jgi:hypothetical protein